MTVTNISAIGNPEIKASPIKNKKQIYQPISEILESVDFNSFRVSKLKYKLVSDLTHDLIFSNSFNNVLKLRAIFSWLSFVDPLTLNFHPDNTTATTLNQLNHGGSYAQAFNALAQHLGLETKCVRGWGKGEDYVVGEDLLSRPPNHTWNAVEIEGGWFLIDCFWSRTKDLSDLDDFFFLTDPHQLIYSHFPEDSQWQLLSSPTKPYTPKQFLSIPYLKPEFFKLSLTLGENYHQFMPDSNTQCISLGHNGRVGFSFKLSTQGGRKDLRGHVFQEIQDSLVKYYVRPPTTGNYYLHLFATNVFSGYEEKVIVHKSVGNFKLEFSKTPTYPQPFPRCSDACWGIPQIYRHLISPRIMSAYIHNPNKKFTFSLHKSSKGEEVYVRVVHPSLTHQSLVGCISIVQSEHKADITLNQPEKVGECGLEVYIKRANTDGKFLFFCQLLVTSVDYLGGSVGGYRGQEDWHGDDIKREVERVSTQVISGVSGDEKKMSPVRKEMNRLGEFEQIENPIEKLRALYKAVCQLNVDKSPKSSLDMQTSVKVVETAWHNDLDIVTKFKEDLVTYAEVYQHLCSSLGLESEIVEGVVKDMAEDNREVTIRPHTWNIVWVDEGLVDGGGMKEDIHRKKNNNVKGKGGKNNEDESKKNGKKGGKTGVLLDCCWGSRRMIDDFTRTSLISSADDYYFNPSPSQFIYSHLPSSPIHQLLSVPIDHNTFVVMAPLKPPFFQHHLSLPQPPPSHQLISEDGEINFTINLPPQRSSKLELSNSLTRYVEEKSRGEDGRRKDEESGEVMEGYVIQYEGKDCMNFRVRLPSGGDYRLVLFVKEDGDVFQEALEHKVTYHGLNTHTAFPPASIPTWGATNFSRCNKIRFNGGHAVRTALNGAVELMFVVDGLVDFKCLLKGLQGALKGAVLIRKVEERLLVSVQCPAEGEYCMELYANDANDESSVLTSKQPMYLAYQLLIICPTMRSTKPHTFPHFSSHFLGPQSANKFFNVSLSGHEDHFFRLVDNSIQLTYTNQRDVRLCGKLFRISAEGNFEDCSCYLLQQNRDLVTTFETTLPSSAMFVFQLFGSESSVSNMLNIFNVLLDLTSLPHLPSPFPTQFDHWDGVLYSPMQSHLSIHDNLSFRLRLNKPTHAVVLKINDDDVEDFIPSSSFSSSSSSSQIWELKTSLYKYSSPIGSVEVCACFKRGDDDSGGDGDDDDDDFSTLLEYNVVNA